MTDPEDRALPLPLRERVPVPQLRSAGQMAVRIAPDQTLLGEMAEFLGFDEVEGVELTGEIMPDGEGYRLDARLRALVRQSCVVTLEPVVTKIDQPVRREFQPWAARGDGLLDFHADGEDDGPEPLGEVIDLGQVIAEEMMLAIDPYPRAEGAEHGSRDYAPPGAAPVPETRPQPFASLAELKAKLAKNGD